MGLTRLPFSVPGQFITALLGGIMILGSPGCDGIQLGNLGQFTTTVSKNPIGFLINTDTASNVLGGIRLDDGSSAYAYGSFKGDGTIDTLTAAVLRDAEGKEASALFDQYSGKTLLKSATSFDGSRVDITYDVVSDTRLTGHVDVFFAEINETHTVNFDVDLLEALAELAQRIEELTGIPISTTPLPDQKTAKLVQDELASGMFGKDAAHSQLFFSLYVFSFQYAFANVGLFFIKLMGHVMEAMVHVLVGVVVAVTRVMIVAMCTPFILLGEMFRLAFDHTAIAVNFSTQLDPDVVFIPGQPGD